MAYGQRCGHRCSVRRLFDAGEGQRRLSGVLRDSMTQARHIDEVSSRYVALGVARRDSPDPSAAVVPGMRPSRLSGEPPR